MRIILFSFLIASFFAQGSISEQISFIGPQTNKNKVRSVEAAALVKVSDGSSYTTFASWRGSDRALFHMAYPDSHYTMGRSGEYYWSYDGQKQQELPASAKVFILGHQFHAQLIRPDAFEIKSDTSVGGSANCDCNKVSFTDDSGSQHQLHIGKLDKRPRFWQSQFSQHGTVTVSYDDWREVGELTLPYAIDIEHEGKQYQYRYTDIQFNQKGHQDYLPPESALADEQLLIRLHRDMMDAHIESDAELMAHIWADKVTMVNRGDISSMPGKQAHQRMSHSLKARKHSEYKDLQRPQVTISKDGTLGHLMAQVQAKGVSLNEQGEPTEPFEFISAWLATFEKVDGQWKITANASNFAL